MTTELRPAIRSVLRRPAMSASLVLTMALGIGATTAVFSVLDATVLHGTQFAKGEELVDLWTLEPDGFSHPRLDAERVQAWTSQPALFARVERFADKSMLVTGGAEPEEIRAVVVSPGLLPMLGVQPRRGRGFTREDAAADAPNVVIVSDEFYRRYLGAVPLERHPVVHLDDRPYAIVGVMPATFRYPRGVVSAYLPLRNGDATKPQNFNYDARLVPGLTHDEAVRRFAVYSEQLTAATPRKEGWAVSPIFLAEPRVNKDVRMGLWVIAGAVLCVLLVACVNTANLLLVQGTARQRELAIRGALGATRARLVRQLLLEAALLALPAIGVGVSIAYGAVHSLIGIVPIDLTQFSANPIRVDARVLGFSILAGVLTWLLCGVGPALQASGARASLVSGQRMGTAARGTRRLRNGLVIGELALSLMLLAGAGLFMRSLSNLLSVDPGFDAAHTLLATFRIPSVRYTTPAQRDAVLADVVRAVRGVPGVRGVTVASGLPPYTNIMFGTRLEAEGSSAPAKTGGVVIPFSDIDTAFFSTMRVPLLRGRAFTAADMQDHGDDHEGIAIIDPRLAHALWPSDDPIGKRFRLDEQKWTTVVGVAGTVKLRGADDRDSPYSMFFPLGAHATQYVPIAVATVGDPAASIAGVRRAIRSVSADLPVMDLGAAAAEFAGRNVTPKFILVLMSAFAGLALVLAVIGVYGVLSYSVAQRTREIGIRMALGAHSADIVSSMFREGAMIAGAGTAIGLTGALLTGRLATSLLFGVAPTDPLVLAIVSGVLIVAAMVAMLAPTLRASRVSPLVAMSPD
ncbi:MAG: permease [Gemmatimonadetes bacterium]|nr:permease [Gemmatimonadota bacterium]